MYWFWVFFSFIFRRLSEYCAGKAQLIEKRMEENRVAKIEYLLSKPNLTRKEAKRLDTLLGKGNEVIVLK